jgi:hypothetical protein
MRPRPSADSWLEADRHLDRRCGQVEIKMIGARQGPRGFPFDAKLGAHRNLEWSPSGWTAVPPGHNECCGHSRALPDAAAPTAGAMRKAGSSIA